MNKYTIIWSPKARDDLSKIYHYISYHLKEKVTANKLIRRLLDLVSSLDYLPNRYPKVLNSKKYYNSNIRKLLVGKYVILYEVNSITHQVFILHIYHSSQNYFIYL
ncbi:MAG: type II toxin-antitoxin system RelE/ParE family toxin [Clostridia bacterium]|nr:type II toxin-antitoxin system RelE/ParE family toxin [Clostridia bacterium]